MYGREVVRRITKSTLSLTFPLGIQDVPRQYLGIHKNVDTSLRLVDSKIGVNLINIIIIIYQYEETRE